MKRIILGDNAEVLPTLPEKFARLIYIDPPFNTGKVQRRDRIRVTATDVRATEVGSAGGDTTSKRWRAARTRRFDDFEHFLMPRIEAAFGA